MKQAMKEWLRVLLVFPSMVAGVEGREMRTDRPDTTESAYSVEVGRWQVEAEVASGELDGGEWGEWVGMEMNWKYGVGEDVDVQVVVPFVTVVSGVGAGVGDVTVRVKRNVLGNDGGRVAMALMPYVALPTGGELGAGGVEGGLIVPVAVGGVWGWETGAMVEAGLVRGDGGGLREEVLVSATAGHELTETSGFFVEAVGVFGGEDGLEVYGNAGVTWEVRRDWVWDAGVRVGLTAAAVDFSPFVGLSVRF